jgi:hypothetical protein
LSLFNGIDHDCEGFMVNEHKATEGVISVIRRWVKDRIIQEAPEEVARCEFECRALQCNQGHWESCGLRRGFALASPARPIEP